MTKQPVKVYKWDMDGTLILLKSLLVGSYARDFEGLKDCEKSTQTRKRWENLILELCDEHFFYEEVTECRSKRDSPSLFSHARSIMYALKEKKIDMRPVYGGWEQHLGLEHTATTPKRSYLGNNQNRHSFEKPVRIYN
ncbi:EYES ABSENT-like protein [Zea mays]|uniref:protein-tyrosine-phosphatase n=1 Tax=Zea mays TaxID=4577 RepID=A0A1D6G0I3_MAIZE|nr:EYES ABSENT-like protein [Zea mays]